MKIVIIPAKGGSKRLPNKNMYPINGRPLIEYAIKYVKNSKIITSIYGNEFTKSLNNKMIDKILHKESYTYKDLETYVEKPQVISFKI